MYQLNRLTLKCYFRWSKEEKRNLGLNQKALIHHLGAVFSDQVILLPEE